MFAAFWYIYILVGIGLNLLELFFIISCVDFHQLMLLGERSLYNQMDYNGFYDHREETERVQDMK